MSFIAELRRRNVIRMAGLYLVGAWLVLQVADTLLPVFEAPMWVMKAFVAFLVVGFVAALIFSWVFELTPDGLKRDADVVPEHSIAPQTAQRMNRAIIFILLLAVVYFAFDKFVLAPKREAALATKFVGTAQEKVSAETKTMNSDKSIAVLPFVDMSKAKDQEYFSDGLAETTLDMLSRVPDLKVISRTSSFAFKGKAMDVRDIGKKLGVAHILEGSVQQAGDTLRITAQLIRASDGAHLWSKQYDRKMADIFKIQDEVATEVVKAIQGALPAAEQQRMLGDNTANVEAYQEYLKGIALLPGRKVDDLRKAVTYFERAIEIDPNYARAYAMGSIALGLLGEYTTDTPEMTSQRDRYLERALELSPDLGEAHIAKANRLRGIGDLAGAEKAYKRGIELSPSYSSGYQWYGELLFYELGEAKKGLPMFERAVQLDPLSPVVQLTYSNSLANIGRLDEAFASNAKLLADNPSLPIAIQQQAFLFGQRGNLVQSLRARNQVIASEPSDPNFIEKCTTLLEFGAIVEAKRCEKELAMTGPISNNRRRLQAWLKYAEGDFAGALALTKRENLSQSWQRAEYLRLTGKNDEALVIYQKKVPELFEKTLAPDIVLYPGDTVSVAAVFLQTGGVEKAQQLLRLGIKASESLPFAGTLGRGWTQVYAYGMMGEFNKACQVLADAADQGYILNYWMLMVDPVLEKLRQQHCFEKQFERIRAQAETQVSAARKAGLL